MNKTVYIWGNNLNKSHSDTNSEISIQTINESNFQNFLEIAGVDSLSKTLNFKCTDVVYCINNSIDYSEMLFNESVDIGTLYFNSDNFFYCDNITFNVISLFLKFNKSIAEDHSLDYYLFSTNIKKETVLL